MAEKAASDALSTLRPLLLDRATKRILSVACEVAPLKEGSGEQVGQERWRKVRV